MAEQQTNNKFIVRCDRAGVFYAEIESFDKASGVAELRNARRIHYWRGATECIGISQDGVGSGSRITRTVPSITVLGVIEVIPCSEKAVAILEEYPVWTV